MEEKKEEKVEEKPQHVTLEVHNLVHVMTTRVKGEEKANG